MHAALESFGLVDSQYLLPKLNKFGVRGLWR